MALGDGNKWPWCDFDEKRTTCEHVRCLEKGDWLLKWCENPQVQISHQNKAVKASPALREPLLSKGQLTRKKVTRDSMSQTWRQMTALLPLHTTRLVPQMAFFQAGRSVVSTVSESSPAETPLEQQPVLPGVDVVTSNHNVGLQHYRYDSFWRRPLALFLPRNKPGARILFLNRVRGPFRSIVERTNMTTNANENNNNSNSNIYITKSTRSILIVPYSWTYNCSSVVAKWHPLKRARYDTIKVKQTNRRCWKRNMNRNLRPFFYRSFSSRNIRFYRRDGRG